MMIQGGNQSSYKILDCCEVFDLCLQALKYSSKSHPGGDHRHEKMRDSSDVTPPCKMLRRSDSPENKHIDSTGHSRAKAVHTHRARDRDGGERVVIETIMGLDSKQTALRLFNTETLQLYTSFLLPSDISTAK